MRFFGWIGALAFATASLGCGARNSDTERQLKELESRLTELSQQSLALENRLRRLEIQDRGSSPARPQNTPSNNDVRPELPIVKATPNGAAEEAIEPAPQSPPSDPRDMDDAKRIMIVGEGSRVETKVPGEAEPAATSGGAKKRTRSVNRPTATVPPSSDGGSK